MAAITVDNVSFVYSPGTPFAVDALDKVSFEIKSGKITGIIGRTVSAECERVGKLL